MILDFYDAAGRLASLLAARFGPVTSRASHGVAVDVPALSFGEWLLSL